MKRIYNGVEVTFTNETDYNKSNVVYMIIFPNGEKYIGSTTNKLRTRLCSHISSATTMNKQLPISSAIREFMRFNVKILDTETDKTKLIKIEEFYTIEYNSNETDKGYNVCAGRVQTENSKLKATMNRAGYKHSRETKLKISESRKNYTHSEETKLKLKIRTNTMVIDDYNNIFPSIKATSIFYSCGATTIKRLLDSGEFHIKLKTSFHYVN